MKRVRDSRFLCIDVCLHEKGSTEEDQGYKRCANESVISV